MFLRHLSSFVPRASNHVLASRVSSISTRSTQTTFLAYQAASAARFYGKYRPSLQQEEVARNYARHKQELKMAKKVLQLRQSPEKAASVMRQAMAAEWTDPKKTRVLLLKLAKLKHVDAMVKVGNALWFGEFGFEVDKQRGQGFMQDAADMGDRDAKQYVKEYMKEAAWEAAWDHKDKLRREAQERGELADAGEEGVSEEGLELQVRALMTGEQERVAGLNVKELKAELKALEAPVSGAKPDLSDRLLQVLHSSHKRALYAKILDGQDVSESVEHGELEEGSESESDGEYYYSSEGEDSDMDDFMFTNAGEVEEDTMELLREEEEEGANEIWEDELLQEPHPAADVFEKAEDLLYANEEREGGDDDLKECLQLLARAAIRKNPDAVWRLSELALLGKGLKNGPHLGLAAHYALRGCEMDAAPTSPGGMLALGHGFETGFGFPQKKRHLKALYWYEQAVEGGYEELGEEGMARVRADYTEDGFEEDEEFPALPASTADITDVDVIEEMMRVQEAPLQGNNYETLDELQGAMDAEHPGNNYDTHVDAHNYNASALDAFGMEFGTGEK